MFNVRMSDGTSFGPADLDQIVQWARDGRIPRDALLVPVDGGETISVHAVPEIASVLATNASAPPLVPGPIAPPDEPVSGLIPYKNPAALVGYYLGLFSCFPVLGIIMGPAGIFLGVRGLKRRSADASRKGAAHAWVAIICGTIGTLINLFIVVAIGFGMAQ